MGLKETNLMLSIQARSICCRPFYAEVIIDKTLVDRSCRLRDKLSSAHGLTIPVCCAIKSDLSTLLAARVGRILVRRR